MTPFYISSWELKENGIKDVILDLNRTQMFSEQLFKKMVLYREGASLCLCHQAPQGRTDEISM